MKSSASIDDLRNTLECLKKRGLPVEIPPPGGWPPKKPSPGLESDSVTIPDVWKALEEPRKELAAQRKPEARWMGLKEAAEYASLARLAQSEAALRAETELLASVHSINDGLRGLANVVKHNGQHAFERINRLEIRLAQLERVVKTIIAHLEEDRADDWWRNGGQP